MSFYQYQFLKSGSKQHVDHSQKTARLLLFPLLITALSLLSACGGGGGGGYTGGTTNTTNTTNANETTNKVIANPDTISTQQGIAVNIPVLVNDSGFTTSSVVSIEGTPSNGNVTILSNNTVTYTPNTSYTGTDSFSYQISNNGNIAIATVTVNVQCSSCSQDKIIALSWEPSVSGSNSGYLIYFGDAVNNVKTLAFDLNETTGLNPDAPFVAFSAMNDLQLAPGDYVCFKVRAYSSSTTSTKSNPACGNI